MSDEQQRLAASLLSEVDSLDMARFRIVGGYTRYSDTSGFNRRAASMAARAVSSADSVHRALPSDPKARILDALRSIGLPARP